MVWYMMWYTVQGAMAHQQAHHSPPIPNNNQNSQTGIAPILNIAQWLVVLVFWDCYSLAEKSWHKSGPWEDSPDGFLGYIDRKNKKNIVPTNTWKRGTTFHLKKNYIFVNWSDSATLNPTGFLISDKPTTFMQKCRLLSGLFASLYNTLPACAGGSLLVFVGLLLGRQAFEETPPRH